MRFRKSLVFGVAALTVVLAGCGSIPPRKAVGDSTSSTTAAHRGSSTEIASQSAAISCDPDTLFEDLELQTVGTGNGYPNLLPTPPGQTPASPTPGGLMATCANGWAVLTNFPINAGSGDGISVFEQTSDGVWRFIKFGDDSGIGGNDCPQYPSEAVTALGSHLCSGGSTSPPPTGPSGPGYQAAMQEWLTSPAVSGSYQQGVPLLKAITDLQNGLSTDKNTSGYAAAIAELQRLTQLPDAMLTPAQDAQATTDEIALDTFFNTPNLY